MVGFSASPIRSRTRHTQTPANLNRFTPYHSASTSTLRLSGCRVGNVLRFSNDTRQKNAISYITTSYCTVRTRRRKILTSFQPSNTWTSRIAKWQNLCVVGKLSTPSKWGTTSKDGRDHNRYWKLLKPGHSPARTANDRSDTPAPVHIQTHPLGRGRQQVATAHWPLSRVSIPFQTSFWTQGMSQWTPDIKANNGRVTLITEHSTLLLITARIKWYAYCLLMLSSNTCKYHTNWRRVAFNQSS